MKKGIEVWCDYDAKGKWHLIIEKKRGKLTLGEIKECAREWEYDFYLLVLDCFHDEYDEQYDFETRSGDRAVLYRTDLLYTEDER